MRTVKGSLKIGRFEVPYRRYGDSDHLLMCVSGALQTERFLSGRRGDPRTEVRAGERGLGAATLCT